MNKRFYSIAFMLLALSGYWSPAYSDCATGTCWKFIKKASKACEVLTRKPCFSKNCLGYQAPDIYYVNKTTKNPDSVRCEDERHERRERRQPVSCGMHSEDRGEFGCYSVTVICTRSPEVIPMCRDKTCEAETYKACRHPDHGIKLDPCTT